MLPVVSVPLITCFLLFQSVLRVARCPLFQFPHNMLPVVSVRSNMLPVVSVRSNMLPVFSYNMYFQLTFHSNKL